MHQITTNRRTSDWWVAYRQSQDEQTAMARSARAHCRTRQTDPELRHAGAHPTDPPLLVVSINEDA